MTGIGSFIGLSRTSGNNGGRFTLRQQRLLSLDSQWPQTLDIVRNGLILNLDASNPSSYPGSGNTWFDISGNGNHFTLFNSPTFSTNFINFNGSNQFARSASTLNLSLFNQITVEMCFRINTDVSPSAIAFEHSSDWNTNSGGFGLVPNSNGGITYTANSHHTNQNSGMLFNYDGTIGTNIVVHTNIWSTISDSTGRDAYINGIQRNVLSGSRSTSSYPAFRNDFLFIGSRNGNSIFANQRVYYLRIYNRKLTQQEILQNYNAVRDSLGLPSPTSTFFIESSGSFTPSLTGTYEVHCVGGGGGGGGWYGSGGAGGRHATANMTLTAGTAYTVTIGALGAANNVNASGGFGGTGGTTTFNGPTVVTATGGGGGSVRNFGTSGVGGNGGSGGAPAANASTGFGGGGGGYDGSNSSFSTSPTQGGQSPGLGQLGVAIGLGTDTRIPAGGAGGFRNGTNAGFRSGLGGIYQGIYGLGAGHGGNYSTHNEEGQNGSTASGKGSGGGGSNWNATAGSGAPGFIVVRGPI